MVAAYDCFGDWDFFNLAYLTQKLLGRRTKRYNEVVRRDQTFFDLPLQDMTNHGCQDADFALRLYAYLDTELKKREIREQFANTSMKLLQKLVEYEFHGVEVDPRKLQHVRSNLLTMIGVVKAQTWEKLGKKVDLDSGRELAATLSECLGLRWEIGAKEPSLRLCEELAILHQDVEPLVQYKRLRKGLKNVEAVAASVNGNRVYPLFNQVRSSSGRLSSSDPDLFGDDGLNSMKACFSGTLQGFCPDPGNALDCLEAESTDENLKSDRSAQPGGNEFMAKHATMKRLNHDEFLLSVLCGDSGPAMSRRFMLERIEVDSACHDLKVRYDKLFEWVSAFREGAAKRGYVMGPKGRKFLAGLTSSSVEKRKKAADACVRWLVGL
jgi:DNA polymerase I-like protein with 3'-5' exonuclease and polymerase domains